MRQQYQHQAGIYAIEHVPTGRLYIGSSSNIPQRWADHKQTLNRGTHCSIDLQCAWTQDGLVAFAFHILEVCERDRAMLADYEQGYIDAFAPAFNRRMRATRSSLGARYPRLDITECPQGHPYDEANTGHSRRNQRYCRRCAADKSIAKYEHKTPFRSDGPVCQKGHEWSPENTIALKNGTRQCRTCKDERRQSRNERNRERYATDPQVRERLRLERERHREERLVKMREHDRIRREARRAARLAAGTYRKTETCRRGHEWTPENTLQWKDKRLCKTCHDAARAMTPEEHAAHLAQRNERERAGWHDANQRAYQRRLARQKAGSELVAPEVRIRLRAGSVHLMAPAP